MAQITLRLSDELLEELDNSLDNNQTRSDAIRQAIRRDLDRPDELERLNDLERRVTELENRRLRDLFRF